MIYYLPLEHIDKRYTRDMDVVIRDELKKQKKPYYVVGTTTTQTINNKKDFLNSTQTCSNRFTQLQEVCTLFDKNKIKDGDTFFLSDLWAPGIEAIPYMAYFNDKKIKIAGILHAGSFTPSDFVANMKPWAKNYEKALIQIADKVFLGSNQPKKDLIDQNYIENYGNLYVTGIPISTKLMYKQTKPLKWKQKKDIIVFTGRLADEKQPHLFDRLANKYPQYTFIKTQDLNLNKTEYYKLLSQAKLSISFAKQENYGIATIECCAYGVNLLCPNNLSYLDILPKKYRYNDTEHLESKLFEMLNTDNTTELNEIAFKHNQNVTRIVEQL